MTPIDRTTISRLYVKMNSPEHLFIRNILHTKGIKVLTLEELPATLAQTCPTPTLVDDGTVLYNTEIIADYLDQRFPDPALAPLAPKERALTKLILHRVISDWFTLAHRWDHQRIITETLQTRAAISESPYFQSATPTLIDAAIAALLELARQQGYEHTDARYARYARELADLWPAPKPKANHEDHGGSDPFDHRLQAAHG